MIVNTEQSANRQAIVQIEVEPNELEQALDRAYRRVVRQVNINGFRPGKAPRRIVEQRIGRGVLIEEAARDLVPKLTSEAIEEQSLDAIAEPEVEITSLEPLTFTATIPLRPTVTLGDYQSIRVAPQEIGITEEQVDEVIDRMREQQVTWAAPDPARPAAEGDQIVIDLASSVDGEPLEEPQTDVPAVLGGERGLLPELQEAITGLEVGQSTQARVTFPEDNPEEKIAGKEVVFDATLKEIKEKHLPELDDELVQKVSDAQTVAELRERIRTNLDEQARQEARRQVAQAAIDLMTEQATIEMPPILVENQMEQQMAERRQLFERQGLAWQRILEMTGRSEDDIREEMRPDAEQRVRSSLVLFEIARAENITVSEDDITAEIDRLVESYPADQQARARQAFARDAARSSLENSLFEAKILDHLIDSATEGHGYAVAPGQVPVLAGLSAGSSTEPEDETTTAPATATAADASATDTDATSVDEDDTTAPAASSEKR